MSKDLDDLHPDLKPLCEKFLAECEAREIDARVTFTYRTPEEQDDLYAQGRTKPGAIVTSLRGGQSKHNFTLDDGTPAAKAFDIAIYDGGKYITNGEHWLYTEAGAIGEMLGLEWGGRWKKPFDPGHFQIA